MAQHVALDRMALRDARDRRHRGALPAQHFQPKTSWIPVFIRRPTAPSPAKATRPTHSRSAFLRDLREIADMFRGCSSDGSRSSSVRGEHSATSRCAALGKSPAKTLARIVEASRHAELEIGGDICSGACPTGSTSSKCRDRAARAVRHDGVRRPAPGASRVFRRCAPPGVTPRSTYVERRGLFGQQALGAGQQALDALQRIEIELDYWPASRRIASRARWPARRLREASARLRPGSRAR
ncbi:hypothetical protein AAFM48_12480 [Burkholderia pseudomallei]